MLKSLNGAANLAGDGRCDSPGFSAKYLTYSFMDTSSDKIVHFVQVQVGENDQVQSSNAMEKFGCIKGLEELRGNGVEVASLTTDRHAAIKKHMRTKEPDVLHKFDVWHVAKGRSLKFSYHVNKLRCVVLSTHS